MNSELDQAREVAERVARRLSGDRGLASAARGGSEVTSELASVRAGLNELELKIAQLEAKLSSPSSSVSPPINRNAKPALATHSPWLAGINSSYSHPSQEKFGVEEATVTQLVDFLEQEKTCSVEPGGKPCDHCAMCSTRGF